MSPLAAAVALLSKALGIAILALVLLFFTLMIMIVWRLGDIRDYAQCTLLTDDQKLAAQAQIRLKEKRRQTLVIVSLLALPIPIIWYFYAK
ncbi:MAG: hypothetical protein OYH77_06370 [Pseudomonadota bacterium]|nr:hypothetical protein [Pseudomonadota bacterium]